MEKSKSVETSKHESSGTNTSPNITMLSISTGQPFYKAIAES